MKMENNIDSQLNIGINTFNDSSRKNEPGRNSGEQLLQRIISMADTSNVPKIDYQSLKRMNEAEANRRNTILRNEQLLKNPMMIQTDLNPKWTFENMIPNDPATREHRQRAWDFIKSVMEHSDEKDAANLLILGASGSGKSYLAGAIAHELLLRREEVIYRSFPQFMFELTDNSKESYARQMIERMSSEKVSVLVLDDIIVQKKKLTDFRAERLSNILRSRHNANVSTVLTANCPMEYLAKAVGDWCMSALIDIRPVIIDLKNASYGRILGNYDLTRNISAPETSEKTEASDQEQQFCGMQDAENTETDEINSSDIESFETEHTNRTYPNADLDFSGPGY